MSVTPKRNVRVDDPTWAPIEDEAAKRGVTESEIVREALRLYAAGLKRRQHRRTVATHR